MLCPSSPGPSEAFYEITGPSFPQPGPQFPQPSLQYPPVISPVVPETTSFQSYESCLTSRSESRHPCTSSRRWLSHPSSGPLMVTNLSELPGVASDPHVRHSMPQEPPVHIILPSMSPESSRHEQRESPLIQSLFQPQPPFQPPRHQQEPPQPIPMTINSLPSPTPVTGGLMPSFMHQTSPVIKMPSRVPLEALVSVGSQVFRIYSSKGQSQLRPNPRRGSTSSYIP